MMLRLDMAVVEHGAWLPRGQIERAAFAGHHLAVAGMKGWDLSEDVRATLSRHHRQFTRFGHAVVAVIFMMGVRVINAVEVNGVGKIVGVLQDDLYGVSLFHTNHWRRNTQEIIRFNTVGI